MPRAKPTAASSDMAAVEEMDSTQALGNEKTLATVTHVLGLFTLFVGPLVMYFIFKRKASPWLRDHLDEAINYHILLVAAFVVLVLGLVFLAKWNAAMTTLAILILLLAVVHVVFGIVAIIWAARGKAYHFPLDVKIVR